MKNKKQETKLPEYKFTMHGSQNKLWKVEHNMIYKVGYVFSNGRNLQFYLFFMKSEFLLCEYRDLHIDLISN